MTGYSISLSQNLEMHSHIAANMVQGFIHNDVEAGKEMLNGRRGTFDA
jgi:hypothetical protein